MKKALYVIGSIAVLLGLLFLFPALNSVRTDMTTELIEPATDNLTPYVSADGNVYTYNEAQSVLGNYFFWIIALIFVVVVIVSMVKQFGKGAENE